MSKPESAGDSLESILASIRASLAEQSTDALSDQPSSASAASEREAKPRRFGLTQRLAGAAPDAEPRTEGADGDDLSDLLEVPSPALMPRGDRDAPRIEPSLPDPEPARPDDAPGSAKDPLWFLSRREEPEPTPGPPSSVPQPASDAKAAAEPALTRPEVIRASLPPFFGASAPETPPDPAPRPATGAQQTHQSASTGPKPLPDPALVREVSLVAAAAEQAASRPAAPPPAANGSIASSVEPATPGSGAAQDSQSNQALEAMVLDLLKPMLRQWLDENMPRLVAEALTEEVQRARKQRGDTGNT